MFDWLKKLGGGKPWKNKTGLDPKSIELLAEDFAALEKIDPDLLSSTLCYVLDGESEGVLTRLAATPEVAPALRLDRNSYQLHSGGETSRSRFFEHLQCTDPKFFIRLGKIYQAASQCQKTITSAPYVQIISRLSQQTFKDSRLDWLVLLLTEGNQMSLYTWPRKCRPCRALNAGLIEAIFVAEGYAPKLLIQAAFQPELQQFGGRELEPAFTGMYGITESAVRHKDTLLEILNHTDFKQRVYALSMMNNCKVPLEPFLEKLMELVLSSSKQVREQAAVMLEENKPTARPLLEEKMRSGENEERLHAVRLLWQWEGDNARALLEQRLQEEKNKKVIQAIQDLIVAPVQPSAECKDDALQLPPLAPIADGNPLGAETEKAWREYFVKINDGIDRLLAGKAAQYGRRDLKPVSDDTIGRAFIALGEGELQPILSTLFFASGHKEILEATKAFWQRPELQPVHLVRFLVLVGSVKPDREQDTRFLAYGFWLESIVPVFRRTHPEMGLRELAAAFTASGLDAKRIGRGLLNRYGGRSAPFGIPKAQAWPYWMEHLDLLEEAFAPTADLSDFMGRYYQRQRRENALEVLASFPAPPARLVPLLWNLAIGPKSERLQAQRCLENLSDKTERLVPALTAGAAETRVAAADWLGRLGNKNAVDALLAALKREKNELAKGAMMLALEQLGAPVDQFLDRAALLKEAEKGIAKEISEDLKWFPFTQLPIVHWEDTGKQVEPEIVCWWVTQGFKLKSPEPGALLRRYCACIKPSEREALGQFILQAWIAEDTAPIPQAEAENRAKTQAQQMAHWAQYSYQQAQKNPQTQATAQPPLTVEQYYAQILPSTLKQPKGSAIASKGVLSVAGACVGAGAAPVVNRYLKEWYGQRAAQCKALLQMLAWVEHRTATQLMLAVGSRFRTKSIQEEANNLAQVLAERKGWTVAELADRTIPSAGLDESGVLTIDYGPRQFIAKLNEELEFVLADAEGKAIKSLPDPRKDDDEAKATEAKKMFSAAKKELKSVITMQRDRLYEAMCTQRTWPFDDWNLYLNQHPIVRHHCQRLIWAVVQNEKAIRLFRPLADGSLSDAADDPVELKGDDQIRVAHECQVSPEESKLWRQHLNDYEIEPLFEQFGRSNFDLSEERKSESELHDFEGHLLEAFKLRGRANKLGYTRGQAQDGGWFFDYHKRFPTLGIEAIIEFTGNGLPEENRTVALTDLYFNRVGEGEAGGTREKLMFSEVPSVLLSECWSDIRTIAAEGPGFDPEWEKKTQM